jgi:hypothetical protein
MAMQGRYSFSKCPPTIQTSLFLGLFTCLLTGQTFSTSSAAGLSNAVGSHSTSADHCSQFSGSR